MSRVTHARALALLRESRLRQGYAPSTIALEQRVLLALLPRFDKPLARTTTNDVRRVLASRCSDVSRNTLDRERSLLRSLFAVLLDAGHVATNPAASLRALERAPTRPPLLLSRTAVGRLLTAALDVPACRRSPDVRQALALRNRAVLELLYGVGFRAAEVHASQVVDLDLGESNILVRRVKRGRPTFLPLPPSTVKHLARYLHEGRPHLVKPGQDPGHLLVTERGGPLIANQVLRVVTDIARRAGMRAHPHAFRRALATELARAGVPVGFIRELLGHVRLRTTQEYLAVDRAELRQAVSLLEPGETPGSIA